MDFGGTGAEWRTDLKLGIQDVAATEYFRPVGGSRWFVAPRAWWRASTDGVFAEGSRIGEIRTRQMGVALDLGYSLNTRSEIRAGYELRSASTSIQTGDPLLPTGNGRFRSAFVRWVYDGHDRPIIPTRGVGARAETRWFSEEPGLVEDLVRGEASVTLFHPVSSRASIFVRAAGGLDFKRDALPFQQFTLGGTARLSAWNRGEFRGGRFALASAGYLRDLGSLPPLVGDRLYAAAFFESGRVSGSANPGHILGDFALALGTRSPLGALWVGGARGEAGQGKVFFRIGRLF
jgi:NTE family protein